MNDSTKPTDDPAPELERIVEIRDPAVDVTKVMAEIRETLRRHAPFKQPVVPAFGAFADEEGDAFAFHLGQVHLNHDQTWVEINVVHSNLPLIGDWLMRLKRWAHELVVYYVNMHAASQVNVNASLLRALNALAKSRDAELESLRREVEQLRARVGELESRR